MATFQKIISEDSNGVVSVSSKLGVGTSSPIQAVDIRSQLKLTIGFVDGKVLLLILMVDIG